MNEITKHYTRNITDITSYTWMTEDIFLRLHDAALQAMQKNFF